MMTSPLIKRLTRKYLFTDNSGAAMIEAALTFPLFVLLFFGMMEIANYLDSRERVNKVSNQIANVLSSMDDWDVNDIQITSSAISRIAGNQGVRVSYRFCGTGVNGLYISSVNNGRCGYGSGGGSSGFTIARCDKNGTGWGSTQYISVSTTCRYRPLFDYFGYFKGANSRIRSEAYAPMRYTLTSG